MDNSSKKPVASISISGEMILNLHSLNNEGGEGNQIMTRQLTILDKDGIEHTVNGISGDMFKHIHAGHMVNYCVENNINLSNYSKKLDPNRISAEELIALTKSPKLTQSHVIDTIIKCCAICDTHGLLVTEDIGGNKNTPRKSTIEFAWTVGIPDKNNTETYLHTKVVADAGTKGSATGSNEGQNIFHRPANHGAYAFICNIDVYRIGLNDISREYSISDIEREKRYKAVVQSLLSTILNPKGAMTSTQKPHITDFKGVVSISHKLIPAPTISAINRDYKEEIETISINLNKLEKDAIEVKQFDGIGQLSEILTSLYYEEPYKLG
ncbi:MAG: DevR family CRISPR-associated autoregulator [Parabacteroides sp.]